MTRLHCLYKYKHFIYKQKSFDSKQKSFDCKLTEQAHEGSAQTEGPWRLFPANFEHLHHGDVNDAGWSVQSDGEKTEPEACEGDAPGIERLTLPFGCSSRILHLVQCSKFGTDGGEKSSARVYSGRSATQRGRDTESKDF